MVQSQKSSQDAVSGLQPLSYLNQNQPANVLFVRQPRAPLPTDRRYKFGTLWLDTVANAVYSLVKVQNNSASWVSLGMGTSDLDTLTGDSGGPISPTANNIDILGGDLLTVDGSASTLTLNPTTGGYPITPYVVANPGLGGYTSIQTVINELKPLFGPHVIFIQGGALIAENLDFTGFTFGANVHMRGVPLTADGPIDGVTIIGNHIPPTSGRVMIENINLQATSGDVFTSLDAGSAKFLLRNCGSHLTAGDHLFNLPNWVGQIVLEEHVQNAPSIDSGVIIGGPSTQINIRNCYSLGTSISPLTIFKGPTTITNSTFNCLVSLESGANASISGSLFTETLTIKDSAAADITHTTFSTGATPGIIFNSSAISIISDTTINTSGGFAIDGTGGGTLDIASLNFVDVNNIAPTLTLGTIPSFTSPIIRTIDPVTMMALTSNSISAEGTAADVPITINPKGISDVIINNGSVDLIGAASQIKIKGAAVTDFIGQATLVAGTVTIANTNILATDRVFVIRSAINASTALGVLTTSISAGANFTVTALDPTTPASTETNDVSTFDYIIFRQNP